MVYNIYMLSILFRALREKQKHIGFNFSGFLAVILTLFWDGLAAIGVLPRVYIAHFGMLVFLIIQSLVTGKEFADAFRNSKKLVKKLEDQERSRTAFFHNTSHELRTPLTLILASQKSLLQRFK